MGDKVREPFQLSFNGFLKVDFQGARVTSDGGLLLVPELDERLGKLIDEHLSDARQGENKNFLVVRLLPLDLGQRQIVPVVGTGDVARPQHRS